MVRGSGKPGREIRFLSAHKTLSAIAIINQDLSGINGLLAHGSIGVLSKATSKIESTFATSKECPKPGTPDALKIRAPSAGRVA